MKGRERSRPFLHLLRLPRNIAGKPGQCYFDGLIQKVG